MGQRKRNVQATAEETSTPPPTLTVTQSIAKILKAEGNNLYTCVLPSTATILAELPSRFRNTIWMKRGGYVVVDTKEADIRENKIGGEIINVVRGENIWRKQVYWPKEFVKNNAAYEDSDDEEESNVGKMPPSDSEDED